MKRKGRGEGVLGCLHSSCVVSHVSSHDRIFEKTASLATSVPKGRRGLIDEAGSSIDFHMRHSQAFRCQGMSASHLLLP